MRTTAKRRLLPEAAYDFWAHDGRDGEEGPRRDTLADARKDAREMRRVARLRSHVFFSCQVWVEWAVNEAKVLRLLESTKPDLWTRTAPLAEEAANMPQWMGTGINLSPAHHVTFSERPPKRSTE